MHIDVFPSVGEVRSEDLAHKTVIVIDVLRATSTIVTALANGCLAVQPMETIGKALNHDQQGVLLGGERYCKKIQGFHLGNSPLEYSADQVKDHRIVLTTTNGTRAIYKSLKGDVIYMGSFLNGSSCAQKAVDLRKDIVLVCSGTKNMFALEDGLCAGFLINRMTTLSSHGMSVNDLGKAMMLAYLNAKDRLAETLLQCDSGKRLTRLGCQEDVIYCSRLDVYNNVPYLSSKDPLQLQND